MRCVSIYALAFSGLLFLHKTIAQRAPATPYDIALLHPDMQEDAYHTRINTETCGDRNGGGARGGAKRALGR